MSSIVHSRRLVTLWPIIVLGLCASAPLGADQLVRISLDLQGEKREALLALPHEAGEKPAAVVFAFHGHGGTMMEAAKKFACESYWPEAIVAYPQGLKTPGGLVDPKGKLSGWQGSPGEEKDRDLALFDALLDYLKAHYNVDEDRVYALGHSNGGLFAYELMAARGDKLAAIAPIAAIIPPKIDRSTLRPLPVFHAAGRNDRLVSIEWQMETIGFVKKINRCDEGASVGSSPLEVFCSPIGCELDTYIGDGGHEIPAGAIPLIIDFFKRNSRKSG